ncbi:MAG: lipocalin, partial [Xanthobacteraceae bacterium]
MPSLADKAWSPYVAGVVIGLLQIPAFLIIDTALGTSSAYVTVGAAIASWLDPSLLKIDYAAKHVAA